MDEITVTKAELQGLFPRVSVLLDPVPIHPRLTQESFTGFLPKISETLKAKSSKPDSFVFKTPHSMAVLIHF